MAKAYYVEGTIVEIGFQTPSKKGISCWLKLKPSSDFISKEGDQEKVMVVSEEESCILRPLKKLEKAMFPIGIGIIPALMAAKANHLTIRMSFGKIDKNDFAVEGEIPTVSELVVK